MGKDRSQVIGHKVYLGLHTVLCQKLDHISKILIDDKTAWNGRAMDAQATIDKPDLFGGKESGGGWKGVIDVLSGAATQTQNDYLKTLLGSTVVPAFRGVVSLVFRQNYIGNAPFLKPIKVKGSAIYHGYGGWLPDLAPVPAVGNGAADEAAGFIYIAIDASYSMFEWPFERIEQAKTEINAALETLKGAAPSIRIVTFGESATALASIEYLDASDAQIDTMKAWVTAIAYSGTSGQDVPGSGSNWNGAVASAGTFFAQDDSAPASEASRGSAFLGGGIEQFLNATTFGASNTNANSARTVLIVTDGSPEPTTSAAAAAATLDLVPSIATYVVNVGNSDTTYSEIVDTTPTSVSVVGVEEDDISVDTAAASVGPNTIADPVKMVGQWSLGRFSGIWPTNNYNNISLDPFYDTVTANNPNVVTANLWIDISAYPDGSEIYYSDTLNIIGDSGTAVHSYPDYLQLSTITQAQYDANATGTLQVTRNTAYLGSASVLSVIERQHTITKSAGSKYLRVELRFGGTHTTAKVTRQQVLAPTIRIAGEEQGDLSSVFGTALNGHHDRNPAHILRDMIIAPWYGGDGDQTVIGDSFATAAQTLYDEGFGLTFLFETPSDRMGIKRQIEEHIGGHIFQSPATGKWEIKLIRDDYDVGTLTTIDGSMISDVISVERPMQEELPNQVTVEWTKREDGKTATLTDHNSAGVQALGYISSVKVAMPGISYEALASRVLQREILSRTVPLWRGKIKVTYLPADHDLGTAIIIDDARLGMDAVVCRITEIDRGNGRDNAVLISFVEDLFSLGSAAHVVTDDVTDADPAGALPATYQLVAEAPHWVAARVLGDAQIAQQLDEDPDFGTLMATCDQPSGRHVDALITKNNGTAWYQDGTCDFATIATLGAYVDGDADSVTLTTDVPSGLFDVLDTDLIQIGTEIMRIDDISYSGDVATITVGRGALDTVPVAHTAGAPVFFWFEAIGTDGDAYTSGQTAEVRLLPRTFSESLPPSLATTQSVTFASRAIRPYPPGNFQLEAAYSLTGVQTGDLDGTWNHRDRLTQTTATPEDYADGDVGPEASVTYTPQRRILEALDDIFDVADIFDVPDIFAVAARRGPFDYASTTGKTHTFTTEGADLFDAADLFDLSDIYEDAWDVNTVGIELGTKSVRGAYENWQTKWVPVNPLLPPINMTITEV